MTTHKFTRRAATVAEIESIGFRVDRGQAESPKTGAWYDIDNFLVANSATIDGEQKFGQFLYLDDDLPCAERVLVAI